MRRWFDKSANYRDWSVGEVSGIFSVVVKCVDIGKNIGGEGDFFVSN